MGKLGGIVGVASQAICEPEEVLAIECHHLFVVQFVHCDKTDETIRYSRAGRVAQVRFVSRGSL